MTVAGDFDWLDVPFYAELEFGQAREELRLAEATFTPDMSDDLLLQLYYFVLDRADENTIWEVIMDQVDSLLFSRMVGGPDVLHAKYEKGFDPQDHALALEAVLAGALPNKRLVDLFYVAEINSGQRGHGPDPDYGTHWTPVVSMMRNQILARMAIGGVRVASESDSRSGQVDDITEAGNQACKSKVGS